MKLYYYAALQTEFLQNMALAIYFHAWNNWNNTTLA